MVMELCMVMLAILGATINTQVMYPCLEKILSASELVTSKKMVRTWSMLNMFT